MPIIRQANGKPVYIDLPDTSRIENAYKQPSAVRPPPPAPTSPPRNPFLNSQPNNTLSGGRAGIPTDTIKQGLERDYRSAPYKGNAAENIKGTTFDPNKVIRDAEKSAQRPRGASGRPLPNEVPKPPRSSPVATVPPPTGRGAPQVRMPTGAGAAGATIIPALIQGSLESGEAKQRRAAGYQGFNQYLQDNLRGLLGDKEAQKRANEYRERLKNPPDPDTLPPYPGNEPDLNPTGLPPGAAPIVFPLGDYPPVSTTTNITWSATRIDWDENKKSYVTIGPAGGNLGGIVGGGSYSTSTVETENSQFKITSLQVTYKDNQGQVVATTSAPLKTFTKSLQRVTIYYSGLNISANPAGQPSQQLPNNQSENIPGFEPTPQYFGSPPTGQFDGDEWHPSPQWTPPPGLQGSGAPQTIPAQPARKPPPADKPEKDERPRATPLIPFTDQPIPSTPINPNTGQPTNVPGPARKGTPGGYPNQGTPVPPPAPTVPITPEGNQTGTPSQVYQGQTTKGLPTKGRDELPKLANPQPPVTGTTIDFPNTPEAPTRSPNNNPNEPPEREKDKPKAPGIPNISQPSEKQTNLPNPFVPVLPRPATPPAQSPAGTPTQPPPPPKTPTDNPCGNSPCGQKISNQQQQMANAIDAIQSGQLADINADLEEIKEKLEQIRREIGLDKLPATVPRSLLTYTDDEPGETIPSILEFLGWQIRAIDSAIGQFPIKVEVEDSDPAKPGNQTKKYELANLSEALAEVFGLALSASANADAGLSLGIKHTAETISVKNAVLQNQDYLKANASFLGYRGNSVPRTVNYAVSPFKTNSLEDFLQSSTGVIRGWKETDPETVVGYLQRIVFAAGIVKAAFFRDRKANERLQKEIDSILDSGTANDKKAWEEFLKLLNDPNSFLNRDSPAKPEGKERDDNSV